MSTPPNPTPDPTPSGEPLPVSDPFTLPSFLNGPVAPSIPSNKNERLWALIIHLSVITPCLHFLLPLILWAVKKDGSPFVNDQGKEAVNFGITIFIVDIALWIVSIVIHFLGILFPLIFLVVIILSVIAALKANAGVAFRHPFSLRLIK